MASLQRVKVGGRSYWRIVESRRIKGKPRAVPILHLGTADALLDRLLQAPEGQLRIRSYQHGDVAALKAVADRLDVVGLIDREVGGSRSRKASVGMTLLLGALNRAIRPRSKRGWAGWAAGTSLARLFPGLKTESLTSQFFWDQMDRVSLDALRRIEDELTQRIVAELGLKLDTLFYDTTNFFTYIASTNSRPELPQRGKSKQKRFDLRLFSLALLVAREGQIPLYAHVYEGNQVDSKQFPESLTHIRQRLTKLSVELEDVTLVYDKGNNSKANQALVDDSQLGYVASLVPTQHADLLDIPAAEYRPLDSGRLKGVPVLRMQKEIWGKPRTIVLFISEQLKAGQIRGLEQHLGKRLRELAEWKAQLDKPRSGPRSQKAAEKRIDALLSGQHLSQVLHIKYDDTRSGSDRLRFWIDEEARAHLEQEVFGKRMLITNREAWSDEEIMLAYRGQSEVEDVFRQTKDDEHLAVRPQYHWTDQKIHVHTFICLLGLILARIVEWESRKLGRKESLSTLLDLLASVRLAMILRPSGKKGGRPRCQWQLEEAEPGILEYFLKLVPDKAPFVYTPPSS
jgi:transposase